MSGAHVGTGQRGVTGDPLRSDVLDDALDIAACFRPRATASWPSASKGFNDFTAWPKAVSIKEANNPQEACHASGKIHIASGIPSFASSRSGNDASASFGSNDTDLDAIVFGCDSDGMRALEDVATIRAFSGVPGSVTHGQGSDSGTRPAFGTPAYAPCHNNWSRTSQAENFQK